MNPVKEAIYDLLTADAIIVGLVGTRVYHREAPRGAVFPYIIYNRQTSTNSHYFSGNPSKEQTWQVKAIDKSAVSGLAEDIDTAIDGVLHRTLLIVPNHSSSRLLRDEDIEYTERDGTDQYQHVGGIYRLVTEHN